MRRTFLLLLPISLPLWLVAVAVVATLLTARAIFRPLSRFWSANPRRWDGARYGSAKGAVIELRPVQDKRDAA